MKHSAGTIPRVHILSDGAVCSFVQNEATASLAKHDRAQVKNRIRERPCPVLQSCAAWPGDDPEGLCVLITGKLVLMFNVP